MAWNYLPTLAEIERDHILSVLRHTGYQRVVTANILGINRKTLFYKLRAYRAQGYVVDKEVSRAEKSSNINT